MSSEDKDPFRYRHMIPTNALQVRSLANAGGSMNRCIYYVKGILAFMASCVRVKWGNRLAALINADRHAFPALFYLYVANPSQC